MRKLLLLVSAALVLSSPARAQFCPGVSPWVFDDVAASDPFCGYITWMAQNGVSLGCQVIDANHRLYCPSDNVSRKQMAAFMNRLGNVRVEAVDTGPGLTGGPITGIGTINLATTQLLPTTACASNQIPRWNGSAWACSTDANGGGTVTSVGSGTGLTGGPITTTGTLSIATGYQLPQSCSNGQIPKSNGAGGWTCAADATGTGTVTSITAGAGLTGGTITGAGTITADTSYVQARVSATCPAGSSIRAIAQNGTVTCQTDNAGPANAYVQGGNAFGAAAVLGTTDDTPIDILANGGRVMRYEPNTISPNVIGGSPLNNVTAGVRGATIAGGGVPAGNTDPDFANEAPNRVTDAYGTIGGGYGNRAGDDSGTTIDRPFATVGGGRNNTASGQGSTTGGGYYNTASGDGSAIGGGYGNTASGLYGGVVSGFNNTASGESSTVPGGVSNSAGGAYSLAAGYRAKVRTPAQAGNAAGDLGAFAWADHSLSDFFTTAANEFAVRATGGVRFVTAIDGSGTPTRTFSIGANGQVTIPIETSNPNLTLFQGTGADYARLRLIRQGGSNTYWDIAAGTASDVLNIYRQGNGNVMSLTPGAADLLVMGNGARLTSGGAWTNASDRNAKENVTAVDTSEVLSRVVGLPVTQWSYKAEPGVRRMGPMAQDFHGAFGLGSDERSISTVDASGVALAAIQGLNAKLEAKISEQAREIAELKAAVELLMARTSPESRIALR